MSIGQKHLEDIAKYTKIIIYDIEVFSSRWSIVFKKYEDSSTLGEKSKKIQSLIEDIWQTTDDIYTFHYAPSYNIDEGVRVALQAEKAKEVRDFMKEHEDYLFIGYNNLGYDFQLLRSIQMGQNPYWLNQFVIPFSKYFNINVSNVKRSFWDKAGFVKDFVSVDGTTNKNRGKAVGMMKSLNIWNILSFGWDGNVKSSVEHPELGGRWKLSSQKLVKLFKDWYFSQDFYLEQRELLGKIPGLNPNIYITEEQFDVYLDQMTFSEVNRLTNKPYEIDLLKSPQIEAAGGSKSLKSLSMGLGFPNADLESLTDGVITFRRQVPFDIISNEDATSIPDHIKLEKLSDEYNVVQGDKLWKMNLSYNTIDVLLTELLVHKSGTWALDKIGYILTLRNELEEHFARPSYHKTRKELFEKNVKINKKTIKILEHWKVYSVIEQHAARIGILKVTSVIQGVINEIKVREMNASLSEIKEESKCTVCKHKWVKKQNRDNSPSVSKSGDNTSNMYKKEVDLDDLHTYLHTWAINLIRKNATTPEKFHVIKEGFFKSKCLPTLQAFVDTTETLNLNRENTTLDGISPEVDNYLPVTFLGRSDAALAGTTTTLWNKKLRRTASGYQYNREKDNTKKFKFIYDADVYKKVRKLIEHYNPKGLPVWDKITGSVVGKERTKFGWEMWKNSQSELNWEDYGLRNPVKLKLVLGGAHWAIPNVSFNDVNLDDATSYYPNLIRQLGLYKSETNKFQLEIYESLINKSTKLKNIMGKSDYAKKLKKDGKDYNEKDILSPDEYRDVLSTRTAYKLGINIIFGSFGSVTNPLYNYNTLISATLNGQILMTAIGLMLDPIATLIQLNTDGWIHKLDMNEEAERIGVKILEDWTEATGIVMESDKCKTILQKDINSYILDMGKKVKSIGDFKVYGKFMTDQNQEISRVKDYIVLEAAIKEIIQGVPVEETIMNETNAMKFMSIGTGGKSFDGVALRSFDESGTNVYSDGKVPDKWHYAKDDRINKWRKVTIDKIEPAGLMRIYKANKGNILTKVKFNLDGEVDYLVKGSVAKVAGTTSNTGIANMNLVDVPKSEWEKYLDINYQFYINEAKKIVAPFKLGKMVGDFSTNYKERVKLIKDALYK